MGLLDGKVAVITGAGSGMGRASTEVFVREGARVIAGDITGAEKETAAALGEAVHPVHCDVTDEAMLKRVGEEGALAMVCDSTNVFVEGEAGSEARVRANLVELVRACKCRVAVTCFASNLARVESIALSAVAAGRRFAGKALPIAVWPRPRVHR